MPDDSDTNRDSAPDYEAGYGKPPKASRWQPGQSGNPRGRTKGSRGLKTDLGKALNVRTTIKINGKVYKGATQELAMLGLAMRAAAGDLRAAKELSRLVLAIFGPDDRGGEKARLSAMDQELLRRALGEGDELPGDDVGEEGSDA